METYVVLYNETYKEIQLPYADDPLCFICEADDEEHAREQCLDAYPNCHIVWVDEFNPARLYSAALDDYYYVLEEECHEAEIEEQLKYEYAGKEVK